jgi:hypothetical protein
MWFIPIKIASPTRNERFREVAGRFHVLEFHVLESPLFNDLVGGGEQIGRHA